MAFPSDITVNTKEFALVQLRPQSSLRRDAASPVNAANDLTISHETAKSGLVSSVILRDHNSTVSCDTSCDALPISGRIRAQFKISYNPSLYTKDGTDITAELDDVISDLIAFVSDTNNIIRILNQEV